MRADLPAWVKCRSAGRSLSAAPFAALLAIVFAAALSEAPIAAMVVVLPPAVPTLQHAPAPAVAASVDTPSAPPGAAMPPIFAPLAPPLAAPVAAHLRPGPFGAASTGLHRPIDLAGVFSTTLGDAQFATMLGFGVGVALVAAVARSRTRRRLGWGVLPNRRPWWRSDDDA